MDSELSADETRLQGQFDASHRGALLPTNNLGHKRALGK
jgi:hypothetical protein